MNRINTNDTTYPAQAQYERMVKEMQAGGPEPEETSVPAVMSELNYLGECVKELEQTIHLLIGRLSPVMLPGKPKAEVKDQADMVCPLADSIRHIRFQVGNISEDVHEAHRLLQL